MSDASGDATATLMQTTVSGKGWSGARGPGRVVNVMTGSISDIAHYLQQQDIEEIWRFTIVTADGRHIRSTELRELIRRCTPAG